MITLENWRERMSADMRLRDYRPRTRSAYELATRLFLDWAKTEPAELTQDHVRAYFLFLRREEASPLQHQCTWLVPRQRKQPFLVPVEALSDYFRGRFLHLARRAVPMLRLPVMDWDKRWVVFAKPVARPSVVLDYLARYIHRTALSDKAITSCDDRGVSFTYRDSRDGLRKAMTLPANEFLRRFLQHVPLRGLHRVRAFGLLHPRERNTLRRLQLMLAPRTPATADSERDEPRTECLRCPHCKQPALPLVRRLSADECAAFVAATAHRAPLARGPPVFNLRAPLQ